MHTSDCVFLLHNLKFGTDFLEYEILLQYVDKFPTTGCGQLWVTDGVWKTVFPHCMFKVEVCPVLCVGLPTALPYTNFKEETDDEIWA